MDPRKPIVILGYGHYRRVLSHVLQVWCEKWVYVKGDCHTVERCPVSMVGDREVCTGEPEQPACWWAQYMNQTDPVWGETARDAARECFEMYGNDDDSEERSEYAAVLWECRKLDNERKGA